MIRRVARRSYQCASSSNLVCKYLNAHPPDLMMMTREGSGAASASQSGMGEHCGGLSSASVVNLGRAALWPTHSPTQGAQHYKNAAASRSLPHSICPAYRREAKTSQPKCSSR